jgi:hypothetical protein
MVGKASLIVILGFSLIFGIASRYWNKSTNSAIENFVNYYDSTSAHILAISATNILADSLFWNQGGGSMTNLNIGPLSFQGGTFWMTTTPDTIDGEYDVLATAVAQYTGFGGHVISDTVQILMQPGRFNQWAYFTDKDSAIYWTTGETLVGRYHTNGTLYLDGAPTFTDNVSTGVGLTTKQRAPTLVNPSSLPDANGNRLTTPGYQNGVLIPLPSSLANYESIPNVTVLHDSLHTGSSYAYDVYMTFSGTNLSYYTVTSSVSTTWSGTTYTQVSRVPATGSTTAPISSFGDAGGNGLGSVVLIQNGDLHVSGQMDGKLTLVAEQGSGSSARVSSSSYSNKIEGQSVDVDLRYGNGSSNHNAGNIIINGNVTYTNPPVDENDARDLLGLVADNSIAIGKQTSANLTIDASLFARQGKFFNSRYQSAAYGTLTLYGSMAQKTRGAVGTVGTSGYVKNYTYDPRFARTKTSPPMSPSTGSYNVIYWRE